MDLSEAARKQGELWGRAVLDWVQLLEPNQTPIWQAALERLAIGEGTKLLDAGCGAGGGVVLASKLGADVAGIDASVPMLTVARERMPKADFRIGELQSIPFANAVFDAVMAVNSLQFAAEPQLGLHELGRVVKIGGRVAVVIFDSPELSDVRVIFEAVQSLFEKKPSSRGPFTLSDSGVLEGLFEQVSQLRLEKIDAMDCVFSYADAATALRAQLSTGPTQRAIEIHGVERVSQVLRRALSSFARPDGTVALRNRFRVAAAVKV